MHGQWTFWRLHHTLSSLLKKSTSVVVGYGNFKLLLELNLVNEKEANNKPVSGVKITPLKNVENICHCSYYMSLVFFWISKQAFLKCKIKFKLKIWLYVFKTRWLQLYLCYLISIITLIFPEWKGSFFTYKEWN